MKHQTIARTTLIVGTVLLLTANSAWSSVTQEAAEAADTDQPVAAVEAVSDEDKAGSEPEVQERPGMDIPMDGSSLEAWNASLEKVKEAGGPKAVGQIQDAFQYLLTFDLGARNDPALLASRLNGLTGSEIVKRVGYSRSNR